MSADRELLELAAKAYWSDVIDDVMSFHWDEQEAAFSYTYADKQDHNGNYVELLWNPFIDDGDAFRLAVKLQVDVKQYGDHVVAWFDGGYIGTGRIPYEGDPCAATRRAIVRAAAEIGKAIP